MTMTPSKAVDAPADDVLETTGTEVATINEGSLLALNEVDRQAVGLFLSQARAVESVDTDSTTVEILARILSSESADQVLAPLVPVAASAMVGFPIIVDAVRWMKSDFAEGAGMYALIDAVDQSTGEKRLITCGGMNVLAQLFALERLQAFPVHVKITRAAKATANGYFPLWLEPVPAP